jgi:2,4-dienoyl-CoA reductase (NADPH2)
LLEALPIGSARATNRVLFGPHETNLGRGRAISPRHAAYYSERAAGGTGILVAEEASVHDSDWPYERSPLAAECGPGWEQLARIGRRHDTVMLAALGHSGGQGASAYSQRELWAPR